MKVKLTTCTYVLGKQTYGPGDIIDLPDPEGQDLVAKGGGEAMPPVKKVPHKDEEA